MIHKLLAEIGGRKNRPAHMFTTSARLLKTAYHFKVKPRNTILGKDIYKVISKVGVAFIFFNDLICD